MLVLAVMVHMLKYAQMGERPPKSRARHVTSPSGAPQVLSHSEPAAASTVGPRAGVRPRRAHAPTSPLLTPGGLQASMASAVAPVHGHGAPYQSWCRAS